MSNGKAILKSIKRFLTCRKMRYVEYRLYSVLAITVLLIIVISN